MAQHRYEVWIDEHDFIGHIETSDARDQSVRNDGLALARTIWDRQTSIHQISVHETGFMTYFDLALSKLAA